MTGRPVDIEIVPKAHALLSASSAERWLECPPSARIEEALEDEDSQYAGDGTAAHAFGELMLRYRLGEITRAEYDAAYDAINAVYAEYTSQWTQVDRNAVTDYVDYVLAEYKRLGGSITIEARVDYSHFAEGGFGTSDVLIVNVEKKIVKAIDLKFGKGVPVSAANNPQPKLYTLGGFLRVAKELGMTPDYTDSKNEGWTVEWTIHQPRLDYVGTDSMTLVELLDWAENVVRPAAELAWEGKGELHPTAKGCRFCKAAGTCRARAAENVLIARRDFMDDPNDLFKLDPEAVDARMMGADEIARILPELDGWIAWANKFKDAALRAVRDEGKTIDGYKLVRGRSNRAWRDDVDLKASLLALGVSETDMFVQPEPSIKSVAQLEGTVGKKEFAAKIAPALVVKPLGTPALVPESDDRPAIDAAAEAARAFGIEPGSEES